MSHTKRERVMQVDVQTAEVYYIYECSNTSHTRTILRKLVSMVFYENLMRSYQKQAQYPKK